MNPQAAEKDAEETFKSDPTDEIGLTSGAVLQAQIVLISEKEIVYRQKDAFAQIKIPVEKVQFIRRAGGEYRFFQPTAPISEPSKRIGFYLITGINLHVANNSGSKDLVTNTANYLANNFNQANNPKGFTADLKKNTQPMQWQFFAEPRIYGERWMLGLSVGYATFSQISSSVQSPNYIYELAVSLTGFFIPVTAIYYWRLPLTANATLNLGFGGGLLYTSVKFSINDDGYNISERYTSWNAMLVFKPEFTYKLEDVLVIASLPVYFAESRKVESGSDSLSDITTNKVISPNLTGIGLSIAFGYQFR
ncbi:MAG: hypothetical protein QM744_19690 [Mesorhizobium sp.]